MISSQAHPRTSPTPSHEQLSALLHLARQGPFRRRDARQALLSTAYGDAALSVLIAEGVLDMTLRGHQPLYTLRPPAAPLDEAAVLAARAFLAAAGRPLLGSALGEHQQGAEILARRGEVRARATHFARVYTLLTGGGPDVPAPPTSGVPVGEAARPLPGTTPPIGGKRDARLSLHAERMTERVPLTLPVSGLVRERLTAGAVTEERPGARGEARRFRLPHPDAQPGDYLWLLLPAAEARKDGERHVRAPIGAGTLHLKEGALARAYLASLPHLQDREAVLAELGASPLRRLSTGTASALPDALGGCRELQEDRLLGEVGFAELCALLLAGHPRPLAARLAQVPCAGGMAHRDPYRLYPRLSFEACDAAAKRLGLTPAHPTRSAALAAELLARAAQSGGHTHLPVGELHRLLATQSLLDEEVAGAVRLAAGLDFLLLDGERAYPPAAHRVERLLADTIRARLKMPVKAHTWTPGGPLNREQRQAVTTAGTSSLSVLTGGPGTGKSTALRALCDCAETSGLRLALCAPTGKAAQRLTETTGKPAGTIHRLLEMTPGGWKHHKENPLRADLVIVDESSMIPDQLLLSLLRAVSSDARVMLVGDADQLAPIEPGRPFAVLDGLAPTTRLSQVYRQQSGSRILDVALALLTGDEDYEWPAEVTPVSAADEVARVAAARGLQLLTPMRRGPLGAEALNAAMQRALGRAGGVEIEGGRAHVGDPVIQTRNDYAREVFNGSLGVVVETTGSSVNVEFESGLQRYVGPARTALMPAYALTIHRAQGSEWERVGVVLHDSHRQMLTRTLAYTAVTRAREELHLFGTPIAWDVASARRAPHRHSHLAERVTA